MVVNELVGIEVNMSTTTVEKVRHPAISNRVSCVRDVRLDEKAAAINYHENRMNCGTDINNPTSNACTCLM